MVAEDDGTAMATMMEAWYGQARESRPAAAVRRLAQLRAETLGRRARLRPWRRVTPSYSPMRDDHDPAGTGPRPADFVSIYHIGC